MTATVQTSNAALPAWHLEAFDPPNEATCSKLSAFLVGQHSGTVVPEKLRFASWKLAQNEAGPGFASAMVNDLGDFVSCCTVTPKRLWLGDREARWAEIGDTFTDDRYQRKGMFGALVNGSRSRAEAAGYQIIYGLPNDQSLPGYINKLNFAVKDDLEVLGYSIPLSSAPVGVSLAKKSPLLTRLLKAEQMVSLTRGLARSAVRMGPSALQYGLEATRVPSNDFDELWQRARVGLPRAQVRDARYIEWRYLKNPFDINLYTLRDGGRLKAYFALLIRPATASTPLRHAMLLDWLYAPADGPAVGRAVLWAATTLATAAHADLLTVYMSPTTPIPVPVPKQGPFQRGPLHPAIIYKNKAGSSLLEERVPWHFTLSDTDAF